MAMRPRRATWPVSASVALLAGLLTAGCYTPSGGYSYPPPVDAGYYPPPTEAPYAGGPYYEPPAASVAVAGPFYGASIGYHGVHPHPVGHALGPFCHRSGAHHHDYAPYRNHLYAFHDGYYFWVGDPLHFRLAGPAYAYHGHHPHPHHFGGYCYISGRHHHRHPPRYRNHYSLRSDVFFFTGRFGRDYHESRHRYDERGWRRDHRHDGYRDHERHVRQARDRRPSQHHRGDRHASYREPSRHESARTRADRPGRVGVASKADRAGDPRERRASPAAPPRRAHDRSANRRDPRADERRTERADDRRDVARVVEVAARPSPRPRARAAAPVARDRRVVAPKRRATPVRATASPDRRQLRERPSERSRRAPSQSAAARRPVRERAVSSPSPQPAQVESRSPARQVAQRSGEERASERSARSRGKPRKGGASADVGRAEARDRAAARRSRAGGR